MGRLEARKGSTSRPGTYFFLLSDFKELCGKPARQMVGTRGFEPLTSGFVDQRSIRTELCARNDEAPVPFGSGASSGMVVLPLYPRETPNRASGFVIPLPCSARTSATTTICRIGALVVWQVWNTKFSGDGKCLSRVRMTVKASR